MNGLIDEERFKQVKMLLNTGQRSDMVAKCLYTLFSNIFKNANTKRFEHPDKRLEYYEEFEIPICPGHRRKSVSAYILSINIFFVCWLSYVVASSLVSLTCTEEQR